MRNILKKVMSMAIALAICFMNTAHSIYAQTEDTTYWAYSKSTTQGTAFYVKEGDEEKVVYCYNHPYNQPGSSYEDSSNKTYYTKTESYLDSNDELMDIYGKEMKERIATILAYGYPNDISNLISKYNITADEARYITQQLIWAICSGDDSPFNMNEGKYLYYDELLELSKVNKFEQGELKLIGDFSFKQEKGVYKTPKLYAQGSKGTFNIDNLPNDMVIKDFKTNKIIKDSIKVGQEFYLESTSKPQENLELNITYKYQKVKIVFYKYSHGGVKPKPDQPFQNLIGAEIETQKTYSVKLNLSIEGDFEKVPEPDTEEVLPEPDIDKDFGQDQEEEEVLPEPDIDKDFGQDQEEEEVLPEPDIDKDFSQDQEEEEVLPEPDIDKDFGQDQEEEEVLPEPDIDKDFSQDQEEEEVLPEPDIDKDFGQDQEDESKPNPGPDKDENPKTGDVGIKGVVSLGITSVILLYAIRKKY